MGCKGKETTEAERNQCKSLKQISEAVGRPCSPIQTIMDRFGLRGSHRNQCKTGHPKVLSKRDSAVISRMIKEDPFINVHKISAEMAWRGIKACPSTIWNECIKVRYNGRVARKKPFTSRVNLKKWLKFANDHKNKDLDFWRCHFFRWEQIQHIWVRRQARGVAEEKHGAGIQEFNPDNKTRGWRCTCMGLYECGGDLVIYTWLRE